MSYAIGRMEKRKSDDITWMENHNERKGKNHSNEDIDPNRTHLNEQLIKCKDLKKKINDRIKDGYKGKRAIRKDANVAIEVLFTSDNEFFGSLSKEQEKLFFEKSLEFLKKFAGEENVMSATIHRDESTPHMHCTFVPLDREGRLRWKSFIDGRKDLSKFQDSYYSHMVKYFPMLQRGEKLEKPKKHKDLKAYKKEKNRELKLIEKKIEEKKEKLNSFEHKLIDKKAMLSNITSELNHKKQELSEVSAMINHTEEKAREVMERFLNNLWEKNLGKKKPSIFKKATYSWNDSEVEEMMIKSKLYDTSNNMDKDKMRVNLVKKLVKEMQSKARGRKGFGR